MIEYPWIHAYVISSLFTLHCIYDFVPIALRNVSDPEDQVWPTNGVGFACFLHCAFGVIRCYIVTERYHHSALYLFAPFYVMSSVMSFTYISSLYQSSLFIDRVVSQFPGNARSASFQTAGLLSNIGLFPRSPPQQKIKITAIVIRIRIQPCTHAHTKAANDDFFKACT